MIYINRLLSVIFHEVLTEIGISSSSWFKSSLPSLFDLRPFSFGRPSSAPQHSPSLPLQALVTGHRGQCSLYDGPLVWLVSCFLFRAGYASDLMFGDSNSSDTGAPPVRRKKSNHSLHCGGLNIGYESKPQYFKSIRQKQDSSQHRL